MTSYCRLAAGDVDHAPYHDHEYGFPLTDDHALFERLCLEIHQAGLSWRLILRRRDNLRQGWAQFHIERVAAFNQKDVVRLLHDPSVIRNRRKIEAIIHNAKELRERIAKDGSFHAWIMKHHPLTLDAWVVLFRQHFRFMGPEIVREFLVSIAVLPGAHDLDCPVYERIARLDPPWKRDSLGERDPLGKLNPSGKGVRSPS